MSRQVLILPIRSDKSAAIQTIIISLENSDGCNVSGPSRIQRWAPRAEVPRNMTAASISRLNRYRGFANRFNRV